MSLLFTQIFNMSVSASYIVLAVLLLRLALKKAPKWLSLLLWAVVGIRLICPFTFESVWSLIPSLGQIHPVVALDQHAPQYTEYSGLNMLVTRLNEDLLARPEYDRLMLLQRLIPVFAVVWLAGILALTTYSIISCLKVRRSVLTAVRCQNNVYQSENVRSPFVFGLIKPKIYLPFQIGERSMTSVIAHEQAHIQRLDHLWKPLGFFLLTLHWFNPLIWLSYVLFCRDLELACDERVIRNLDRDARADYAAALLSSSVSKPKIAACPLAFGEVGVQKRIKSALSYRKPVLWVTAVALVVCLVAAVCFFTEPVSIYNTGVQRVSVKRINDELIELQIKHHLCYSGYSVKLQSPQDPMYVPDGAVQYDGSLGKNRILVTFGDDDPAVSLVRQFSFGQVVELKNAPIRILGKLTNPGSDHGFALYFGMDEDIQIEEVSGAELDEQGGTIRIPIRILSD
jgi:beta-lactamase regulating signal transducer with metallopeptidase domain